MMLPPRLRPRCSAGHTPLFSLVHAGLAPPAGISKPPLPASAVLPNPTAEKPERTGPRIAVIGAGLAGLNAAHYLKKAGFRAAVYEASPRIGGRIHSVPDAVAPGIMSEFGGEYIDTSHFDLLALAQEFGLPLLDRHAPGERGLSDAYYFGGSHYSEAQVREAFEPLAERLAQDWEGAETDWETRRRWDKISLADYLAQIGVSGWMGDLLDVAYLTEFGLDTQEQSSLNLLSLIGTDTRQGFQMYGDSTEQHKIRGGNEQIIHALAKRLDGQIETGHRLEKLEAQGGGFRLFFDTLNGPARAIEADFVLLALPFTMLREIVLAVALPPVKKQAIAELGDGTNTKMLLGFSERPWRRQGFNGYAFTDLPLQVCWDGSQCQDGTAGALAIFLGGTAGLQAGAGTAAEQAARLLPGVAGLFPGSAVQFTGKSERVHWPTIACAQASYACYKPGQWTAFQGHEITPVGNLYFAGDHCSVEFQSYMNGAAETGRRAAQALADSI